MSGLSRTAWTGIAIMVVIALVGVEGCSNRGAGKPKHRRLEGVVEKIDLQNNVFSMRVQDGKGGERILEGTFREDTEVEINGRAAKLEHVQPGDKVVGFGYREGEGEDQKLVATKVMVTRPEGSDWKSTGQVLEKEPEAKPADSQAAAEETAPPAKVDADKPGAPAAERVEDRPEQPANDNR